MQISLIKFITNFNCSSLGSMKTKIKKISSPQTPDVNFVEEVFISVLEPNFNLMIQLIK